MAVDGYMAFMKYDGSWLLSESQVEFTDTAPLATEGSSGISLKSAASAGALFEIQDFSFGIEQTLNIGSQSSGAGAGRITFNPFFITRKIDMSTPSLYSMACSGTTFKNVTLALRKSSGGTQSGSIYLRYDWKLVAVKTMDWAYGDESPTETLSFEYGAMQIRYTKQKPDGTMDKIQQGAWDRVRNVNKFTDIT